MGRGRQDLAPSYCVGSLDSLYIAVACWIGLLLVSYSLNASIAEILAVLVVWTVGLSVSLAGGGLAVVFLRGWWP